MKSLISWIAAVAVVPGLSVGSGCIDSNVGEPIVQLDLCEPNPCTEKAAGCVDGEAIAYEAPGTCVAGIESFECTFAVAGQTPCEYGCEAGVCLPEPGVCNPNPCTGRPGICDGSVPITYATPGECVELANGGFGCNYEEVRGAACASGCQAGSCIGSGPCDPNPCVGRPASCDGNTPVTYKAPGTCVALASGGFGCSYEQVPGAPCPSGCEDGACL